MLKTPALTSDQAGLALGAPGEVRQHVRLSAELRGQGAGGVTPSARRARPRRMYLSLHRLVRACGFRL